MSLSPSDRVSLITQVAWRLAHDSWPVIDLTLREFGAPTQRDWQGDKEHYILEMLEKSSPSCLIDLARHMNVEFETAPPPVAKPGFWRDGYFRLFVSHLATHRAFAGELKLDLVQYGICAFVAHNDIEPATEWQNEIEAALASADGMAALLHPGFHQSNWTDQEIGYAMGRNLLIVSVRLGQDPYGFIGRFQALNGIDKPPSRVATGLFEILRKHRLTKVGVAGGLVASFEESRSYKQARESVEMLQYAEHWDQSLSDRCLAAIEKNRQIKEATGVPSQVKKLISKKSAT